ncbi:hypothetical protein [Aequorivita capsosiphonis]|uniref:hypothetical protein n=1 Tax=Aequorivita capsosiphonis TaxID=487317 RepID=UPI00040DDDF6|nr:hypothetical protein [Aequorivita capsosiphonis]
MKKIYNRIEYLGYYQIVGGIIGILIMTFNIYDKLNSNGFFLFSMFLFFGLCAFSIYSGILLIQKKYLKGLNCSIFIQAIQILSFAILGYIFNYAIGFYIRLTVELTNDTIVGFDFGFVNWNLSRNANQDLIEINFNIIAIILLGFIFKFKEKITNELSKIKENE